MPMAPCLPDVPSITWGTHAQVAADDVLRPAESAKQASHSSSIYLVNIYSSHTPAPASQSLRIDPPHDDTEWAETFQYDKRDAPNLVLPRAHSLSRIAFPHITVTTRGVWPPHDLDKMYADDIQSTEPLMDVGAKVTTGSRNHSTTSSEACGTTKDTRGNTSRTA